VIGPIDVSIHKLEAEEIKNTTLENVSMTNS
jgi:hypothetical protein